MTTEFVRHDLAQNSGTTAEPDRVRVIREGVASYLPDIDPDETGEWLEPLCDGIGAHVHAGVEGAAAVAARPAVAGSERARQLAWLGQNEASADDLTVWEDRKSVV